MSSSGSDPLDEVVVRSRSPNRIRVGFDDEPGAPPAALGEPDVVLRSAALLHGERRVPIPAAGMGLAGRPPAGLRIAPPGTRDCQAVIEPAHNGHAIVASRSWATFLNGERLAAGERRPLRRGDAIALDGELLHYLPAGPQARPLAPITPVDAGRFRAGRQAFTIGRAPDSDLVLDHPSVSRTHALIRTVRGQAVIEDRGSATGVRVNGETIRRARLTPGDQIAVGPFRIVFDGEELVPRSAPSGLPVTAVGVRVDVRRGTILQPTDLQLQPGELVALVGQSGAGKSTLLKALAGVSAPTSGRVFAGGEDVSGRRTEIGYVPQFDIVHGRLTVREALEYAARLRLPTDMASAERATRVNEVIEQLGLSERADNLIDELSGGERKRVAVGTELLHRPGALFLDEPTTGLDPGLERRLMQLLRTFADSGQTVALVTHATASLSLCNRAVVMGRGGYVCFEGTPAEALSAFGVDSFDEIYIELMRHDPATLMARRNRGRHAAAAARLAPVPTRIPKRPLQQSLAHQTRVLAARYGKLVSRDRRLLLAALIQVTLLGGLTALLFKSAVFARVSHGGPAHVYAGKSAQLIFLMVTIAIWLGAISAAREIVKERTVVARELAVGVQVPAYLASKLIVLLSVALGETVLFSAIVLGIRHLHEAQSAGVELMAVLVIASWMAVLMGLVVSALCTTEDQATGVIPLLLVPQLLFGGAIIAVHEMPAPMSVVAAFVPSRWTFATAGHAIHLQQRIGEDVSFSKISSYGHGFFTVPFPAYVIISAAFLAVLFAAVTFIVRERNAV